MYVKIVKNATLVKKSVVEIHPWELVKPKFYQVEISFYKMCDRIYLSVGE